MFRQLVEAAMNLFFRNLHSMIICVTITIFLMILIPCVVTLSFNYTTFSAYDYTNFTYENDTHPADGVIQLTKNQRDQKATYSVGRATYSKPLNLWDKASGNITDFDTHFSFVINSLNINISADGLAFFLAPYGSRIPPTANGGGLGLTNMYEELNTTEQFVAVEFDIYKNVWDPPGTHVGININSLKSVTNQTWFSSIKDGKKNEAWITYDSKSKNLSVVYTGFQGGLSVQQNLSYIVDLKYHLPEMVTFGFTAATGKSSALHIINSWDFSSTLENHDDATPPELAPPTKTKSKMGYVIGSIIGGLILVVGSGLFFYFLRQRKARKGYKENTTSGLSEFEIGSGPKRFLYADLYRATNNFSREKKLGEGGFGEVYKGYVQEMDTYLAVKKISRGSNQGLKEYASEVKIISRLSHRNLVKLIGWCHEKSEELLLVYEFLPNGSLDNHLFNEKCILTWEMRYKIAKGIASALLYLHSDWEQCVVHRDIKASNIMLDSSFNAKVGDFGLARLVDHGKWLKTTTIAGTMGYMSPESISTGTVSVETDVYSFGVVALELACGRKPIKLNAPKSEVNLVEWVWSLYGTGKLLEAADPKLSSDFNKKEMEYLMIGGLWCAHPDNNARPSIRQASRLLYFEAPLPKLPPRMPKPSYSSPSPNETRLSGSSQVPSSIYTTDSSKFSTSSGTPSSSQSLLHTS